MIIPQRALKSSWWDLQADQAADPRAAANVQQQAGPIWKQKKLQSSFSHPGGWEFTNAQKKGSPKKI
jgi:hypothetical protein